MGIFDWFRGRPPPPTLDSLQFDTSSFALVQREAAQEVWSAPGGDIVHKQLTFGKHRSRAVSLAQLRESIMLALGDGPVRLIDIAISPLDGLPSIRMIRKSLQQPSGMTYEGSFSLRFRDFAFVIRVTCLERGITGIRETLLFDRAYASKSVTVRPDQLHPISGDWQPDAEIHDAEFPHHPLSRLRRLMKAIESSTSIAPEARTHRLAPAVQP